MRPYSLTSPVLWGRLHCEHRCGWKFAIFDAHITVYCFCVTSRLNFPTDAVIIAHITFTRYIEPVSLRNCWVCAWRYCYMGWENTGKATLVRVAFNSFLANPVCHRGHLCIKELLFCHKSLPLTFPQVCDSDALSTPGSVTSLQLTRVCGHCSWLLRWALGLTDVQPVFSAVSIQVGFS